jgi:hypothetical protein
VCSNPDLLCTIDIAGMGRMFEVHATLTDALATRTAGQRR